MIVTTTQNVEGKQIAEYKGIVFGEVVSGVNFVKDLFSGITDIFGGRSSTYENELQEAREKAIDIRQRKRHADGKRQRHCG